MQEGDTEREEGEESTSRVGAKWVRKPLTTKSTTTAGGQAGSLSLSPPVSPSLHKINVLVCVCVLYMCVLCGAA